MSNTETERFIYTWSSPIGLRSLSVLNNQPLGMRFMITSFSFFLIGGILALIMRLQLSIADNDVLGPQVYNQMFTMHGSTMMFLFVVPFLEGLAMYLLPLMIGARDLPYPRMAAFSYWMYLFGGMLFYVSFLTGNAPEAGWFSYTPLSTSAYSGTGMDFWVLALGLVEFSGIATGIELVVGVMKFRTIGMSIDRMPLFVWAILVAGMMIIFSFTTLLTATFMLELDRVLETRFFSPEHGGSSLLWQHLFWFFGHPEVYIMFIPATGIVSAIVATFAKRPVVAYALVAMALVVTGFVSFGLWVHHMFTTGLPAFSSTFFTAASLAIAVPSGIQVFAWIATLSGTKPTITPPLLFVLGFFFIFVIGGITGVMVAIMPLDWQVHDSFFVVAHFHYVIIGGVLFPIFGGLVYWMPKMTGRMVSERLGVLSFWLMFLGFNVAFFPMHLMGLYGLPRRVYTYPAELNLDGYNITASAGAFVMAGGVLVFLYALWQSINKGSPAGPNPWNSSSLEWQSSSPPTYWGSNAPPIIERPDLPPAWHERAQRIQNALDAEPANFRANLVTDVVEGEPQAIQWLPGPTFLPLLTAAAFLLLFVGALVKSIFVFALGVILSAGFTIRWLFIEQRPAEAIEEKRLEDAAGLPLVATGSASTAWWAMVGAIAALSMVFGTLLFSYFYIRLYSEAWPQGGLPYGAPSFGCLLIATFTLSALPWFILSERSPVLKAGGIRWRALLSLGFTIVSCSLLGYSIMTLPFQLNENAYAGFEYTLRTLLLVGTLAASVALISLLLRSSNQSSGQQKFNVLQAQITRLFVAALAAFALLVILTLYLSPIILSK